MRSLVFNVPSLGESCGGLEDRVTALAPPSQKTYLGSKSPSKFEIQWPKQTGFGFHNTTARTRSTGYFHIQLAIGAVMSEVVPFTNIVEVKI